MNLPLCTVWLHRIEVLGSFFSIIRRTVSNFLPGQTTFLTVIFFSTKAIYPRFWLDPSYQKVCRRTVKWLNCHRWSFHLQFWTFYGEVMESVVMQCLVLIIFYCFSRSSLANLTNRRSIQLCRSRWRCWGLSGDISSYWTRKSAMVCVRNRSRYVVGSMVGICSVAWSVCGQFRGR